MNEKIIKDMSMALNMPEKEIELITKTLENVVLHNIIESLLKQKKQTVIELPWETISLDIENNKVCFEISQQFKEEIYYGVQLYNSPLSQQLMAMLSAKLVNDFNAGVLFDE